jgi:hypothetical protein
VAKGAANRWLGKSLRSFMLDKYSGMRCPGADSCLYSADNLWALQSWCKKRFEGMDSNLDSFFKENGLTDDLDYVT